MESEFVKNREYYLKDLKLVGINKPLGYLPLDTIVKSGQDVDILIEELKSLGLVVLLLSEEEAYVPNGALYAFHETALQNLLDKNSKLLEDSGWPKTAKEFVLKVGNTTVNYEINGELFDLIADSFADYTNPGRTKIRAERAKSIEKQKEFKKLFG